MELEWLIVAAECTPDVVKDGPTHKTHQILAPALTERAPGKPHWTPYPVLMESPITSMRRAFGWGGGSSKPSGP
jgi:hypothetical protein